MTTFNLLCDGRSTGRNLVDTWTCYISKSSIFWNNEFHEASFFAMIIIHDWLTDAQKVRSQSSNAEL